MKLFLDTADVEAIKRANDTGLLDGVTTNPTHIAKTGRAFTGVVSEICRIVDGPVSAEAVGSNTDEFIAEAKKIADIAPNIYVKIPMTVDGIRAVRVLENELDIRVNVTMIFSSTQALMAMKADASYVSIVLSRLDAYANESGVLIEDSVRIKSNYKFNSEVLAGSVKTQNQILTCLRAGVDIATVPESLFFQFYQHPLTTMGIEQFERDWASVKNQ